MLLQGTSLERHTLHRKLQNDQPLDRLRKTSVPKLRIDGNHRPTNAPSSWWPENHSDTEKTNETAAAVTKPALAIQILLIAIEYPCFLKTRRAYSELTLNQTIANEQ
jgi:hypothetical protein